MIQKTQAPHGQWSATTPLAQTLATLPHSAPVAQDSDGLPMLAERTPIAEVMSRGVVCISADATLDRVTEMLLERDIGSVPVVDAAWRPVGMVSKTDLLQVFPQMLASDEAPKAPPAYQTAGQLAQSVVLSLHEGAAVSVAAAIMAYEGVHRLPVVNAAGEVVGVVSSLDIVRWVARCTHEDLEQDS